MVSCLRVQTRSVWFWGPPRRRARGPGLVPEWVGPAPRPSPAALPLPYLGGWLHLSLSGCHGGKRGSSALSAAVAEGALAQGLYGPRAPPAPRAARRNVSPLLGPYLGVGHWRPSRGRFAAWAPARAPCADRRRSGLAGAQVPRAGPYMERLRGRVASPDRAQRPARGRGPGGARGRARACGCTCPARRRPAPSTQRLPRFSGFPLRPQPAREPRPGGPRGVGRGVGGVLSGWEKESHPECPSPRQGREGTPPHGASFCTTTPERPNPRGQSQAGPHPHG